MTQQQVSQIDISDAREVAIQAKHAIAVSRERSAQTRAICEASRGLIKEAASINETAQQLLPRF